VPLAVDQWSLINKVLMIYKITAIGVTGVALAMTALAFYHATANPVVVVQECGNKSFFEGHREKVKITDDDVKAFIENWVKARYSWSDLEIEKMVRSISPISTDGLQQKLKDQLGKKKPTPAGKDQKIEESVANIQVTLTDKSAIAHFDRIVRINGTPLIVSSEIALEVIEGGVTQWNRLGLYVNGVVERDDK
jgi:hypothetical protein